MGSAALTLALAIALAHVSIVASVPRKRAGGLYSQWTFAHATFYGGFDGAGAKSGACGYLDIFKTGYGKDTVAVSSALWRLGHACGACMEVICINTRNWRFCHKGYPRVTISVTNMCPQSWHRDSNNGGWCNNPRKHLDMSMHAFLQIAQYRAGIVPVIFRRIPCQKTGGIVVVTQGNFWWFEINIQNVAGSGDLQKVFFRTQGGYVFKRMTRSWGATYSRFGSFVGVGIDLILHSLYTGEVLYIPKALPRGWKNGKRYQSRLQFPIAASYARKLIAGKARFDVNKALRGSAGLVDDAEGSDKFRSQDIQKATLDTPGGSEPHRELEGVIEEDGRLYPSASDVVGWETGKDVDEEFKQFLD